MENSEFRTARMSESSVFTICIPTNATSQGQIIWRWQGGTSYRYVNEYPFWGQRNITRGAGNISKRIYLDSFIQHQNFLYTAGTTLMMGRPSAKRFCFFRHISKIRRKWLPRKYFVYLQLWHNPYSTTSLKNPHSNFCDFSPSAKVSKWQRTYSYSKRARGRSRWAAPGSEIVPPSTLQWISQAWTIFARANSWIHFGDFKYKSSTNRSARKSLQSTSVWGLSPGWWVLRTNCMIMSPSSTYQQRNQSV